MSGRFKIKQDNGSIKRVAFLEDVQPIADDLDDLIIDVDELAGADRTTETVKGNADDIKALEVQLDTTSENLSGAINDLNVKVDINKAEFEQNRQETQLKTAKVEKELNDFKNTLHQVNVNQEAKQSASGYGIVSLPKNAANGQVGVSVEGETLRQLVNSENVTLGANWYKEQGNWFRYVGNNKVNTLTFNDFYLKSNTQYTFIIELKDYNGTSRFDIGFQGVKSGVNGFYPKATFNNGINKIAIITDEDISINFSVIGNNTVDDTQYFQMRIMIFEGNHIDNPAIASYISYGTKSTLGAMKVKSVGKNLCELNSQNRTIMGKLVHNDLKYSDGVWRMTNSVYGTSIFTKEIGTSANRDISKLPKLKPNTQYSFSTNVQYQQLRIALFDSDGTIINEHKLTPTTIITPNQEIYLDIRGFLNTDIAFNDLQIERGEKTTQYEPYKESTAYVIAKDKDNKIVNLRSLPNGTKDEISLSDNKMIQKNNQIIIDGNSNLDSLTTQTNTYYMILPIHDALGGGVGSGVLTATNDDGEFPILGGFSSDRRGIVLKTGENRALILIEREKVDNMIGATLSEKYRAYLNQYPITLTYQLAEPEIIPIQVSGNIVSNPGGTIYIEPAVVDANVYNNGITIFEQELNIDYIDKLYKIDYQTGVKTEIDASKAVIAEDKKSFTHPDLVNGDMVFFEYYYSNETTQGETTIEYYDSRYVIPDKTLPNKFYKWDIEVDNGVPSVAVTEV